MNAIERRRYEMLVRVRNFSDTHGHLFPASSVARQSFAAVAAAIAELDGQSVTRSAASAAMLAEPKRIAREALLARLQAIGRTARVLAEDMPGLDQQFHVSAEAADHRLLTTGRRFVRSIEPFSSQCLAHGMPVTFVADLHALVDAFDRALHDCARGRGARRAADANTRAALSRGSAAVRRLDAIVINHLSDDAVTRTVWEGVRRIGYPARVRRTRATPVRSQLALPLRFIPAHRRRSELIDAPHAPGETASAHRVAVESDDDIVISLPSREGEWRSSWFATSRTTSQKSSNDAPDETPGAWRTKCGTFCEVPSRKGRKAPPASDPALRSASRARA